LCRSGYGGQPRPGLPGISDVPDTLWCAGAVKLCYKTGLLNGTAIVSLNDGNYCRLQAEQ
jgi:hypothetical protein